MFTKQYYFYANEICYPYDFFLRGFLLMSSTKYNKKYSNNGMFPIKTYKLIANILQLCLIDFFYLNDVENNCPNKQVSKYALYNGFPIVLL